MRMPCENSAPLSPALAERITCAVYAHGDAVMRLALSQLRNRADAEDAVQETFFRLASNLPHFESDEHMRAWLLRVACNVCRDMMRKRKRKPVVSIDDLFFEPAQHSETDSHAEMEQLWKALDALTHNERVVVHLVCYEELSYHDAASVLGTTEDAVRARLKRARAKLRRICGMKRRSKHDMDKSTDAARNVSESEAHR